jgi:hypothetical protein
LKLERQGIPKRQGNASKEVRARKSTSGPVKLKRRSIYQQKITLEAYGLKVRSKIIGSIAQSQADCDAERTEYSGKNVSSMP